MGGDLYPQHFNRGITCTEPRGRTRFQPTGVRGGRHCPCLLHPLHPEGSGPAAPAWRAVLSAPGRPRQPPWARASGVRGRTGRSLWRPAGVLLCAGHWAANAEAGPGDDPRQPAPRCRRRPCPPAPLRPRPTMPCAPPRGPLPVEPGVANRTPRGGDSALDYRRLRTRCFRRAAPGRGLGGSGGRPAPTWGAAPSCRGAAPRVSPPERPAMASLLAKDAYLQSLARKICSGPSPEPHQRRRPGKAQPARGRKGLGRDAPPRRGLHRTAPRGALGGPDTCLRDTSVLHTDRKHKRCLKPPALPRSSGFQRQRPT